MSSSLRSVQGGFPKLTTACDDFATEAVRISKERKTNRLTLTHHTSLLEILEIPQLMDTLVRNGFYEQALELYAFAQGLGRMHPQLAVVQSIIAEVETTSNGMRLQLLQLLKSDVQLAVCLRVVGYLRRLESYDELALRSVFLDCRDSWLKETIADIPEDNPSNFLVKLADQHRVHVFDIVTQYQSIFGHDAEAGNGEAQGLLCEWVGRKMQVFLSTLKTVLGGVNDSTLLNNIMKQSMYCGLSLSRVGVDFRVLVLPIFKARIIGIFESNLAALQAPFETALQKHDWRSQQKLEPQAQGENMAPVILLEHAPLAAASNYLTMCFNDLRQCAPLALSGAIGEILLSCLDGLVETLIRAVKGMDRDLPQRPPAADAMLKAMAFKFLPHVAACLDTVFHITGGINVEPLAAKLTLLFPEVAEALVRGPPTVVYGGAPPPNAVPPPPGAPPPERPPPKATTQPPPPKATTQPPPPTGPLKTPPPPPVYRPPPVGPPPSAAIRGPPGR